MAEEQSKNFIKSQYYGVDHLHPTKTPEGSLFYNLSDLTPEQQTKLNDLKLSTIKENHKYLASHPEIKAIISIILTEIFAKRPKIHIYEFISKIFNRSIYDLCSMINIYLENHNMEKFEIPVLISPTSSVASIYSLAPSTALSYDDFSSSHMTRPSYDSSTLTSSSDSSDWINWKDDDDISERDYEFLLQYLKELDGMDEGRDEAKK